MTTEQISEAVLQECSQLFSGHYGVWGAEGPRPGESIALSPRKLREYLNGMSGRAAMARHKGRLICYAFAVIFDCGNGNVAWVTQLVTHRKYRNQSVATRLLKSIWSFSDYFAWGLVTANPFAVRALEGATSRKCDPVEIERHAESLLTAGRLLIPYVQKRDLLVNLSQSAIQTEFYVSHTQLESMIKEAQTERKWYLGPLEEGQEWFAFTFGSQEARFGRMKQLEEQLADSEAILKRAYEGMSLDDEHTWVSKTSYEVDFVVKELLLEPKSHVIDLGCGSGRHSLDLAQRGYSTLGVDFVGKRVAAANRSSSNLGLATRARFTYGDARAFESKERFDAGLCLYDVVGSFPDNADNFRILESLFKALVAGSRALLSVMNLSLTRRLATQKFVLDEDASALYALKPNSAMQNTGEVFDPNRFLLDTKTEIIYRKEQFDLPGDNLPTEVIVRDRRYEADSIRKLCEAAGFNVLYTRHVHAGDWVTDLPPDHHNAKEILVLLHKP